LQILSVRVSSAAGDTSEGITVKKFVVAAALLALGAQGPALAASKKSSSHNAGGNCYSQQAIEAEQAIRFMTDVMVVSSECQDTVYAEFRLRNRDAILAYQKAMIAHFHGNKPFDTWNTSLANQAAMKQAGQTVSQICTQSADLMAKAKSFDSNGFRQYAASQAAAAGAQYTKCGK
jgi:lipid A disaccharide synthetase